MSPEHPLAKYDRIAVEMLRNIPLIMLSPETAGRRFIDNVLQKHGIVPKIVMELSSSEEVKRMVELNLGAAVISKLSISVELRLGSLKMIQVADLETSHPVGVIYKSGRYLNSAMQQFLNDLMGMQEYQFLGSE